MNTIWLAIFTLSIMGLFFGAILGYASYQFIIEEDPIAEKIDEILPQSQCGQCGYPGCHPYAEAIANGEKINRCVPGGEAIMLKIAEFLNTEPQPINDDRKLLSTRMSAVIDEANCIGCTKCIQICPVDAIIGTTRTIHTIVTNFCTGCNLCVVHCPTRCIYLQPIVTTTNNWKWDSQTIPTFVVPIE